MAMYIHSVHRLIARDKPYNLFPGGTPSDSMNATFPNLSGLSAGASGLLGPDGTFRAKRYVETATTGVHRGGNTTLVTSHQNPSFGLFSFSISAKAEERTWLIVWADTTFTNSVYFDLANGVVGTRNLVSHYWMRQEDNGFYRCGIAFHNGNAGGPACYFALASADNVFSYTGDIANGMTLFGPMLIKGIKDVPYTPMTNSGSTALPIRA